MSFLLIVKCKTFKNMKQVYFWKSLQRKPLFDVKMAIKFEYIMTLNHFHATSALTN